MSDTTTSAEVAAKNAFTFADAGAPSAEVIEAFKSRAKAAGVSDEAIAATLGRHTGQAPASAAKPATMRADLDAAKLPTFTAGEKEALAGNLAKHWSGDPQVLQDAITAAGIKPNAADPRTEAERDFDTQLGGVAPGEYNLNGVYLGRDAAAIALDRTLRASLSGMEIPAALGRGLATAFLDSAREYSELKEGPARELWKKEQVALAGRAGRDIGSVDDIVKLAAQALARVQADIRDKLKAAGAFETATVVLNLARQAQRLAHRAQLSAAR